MLADGPFAIRNRFGADFQLCVILWTCRLKMFGIFQTVKEGNRAPEAKATPSRNWGGPVLFFRKPRKQHP